MKRDEKSFYSTQIDRKYFITGTRSFMGMRFFFTRFSVLPVFVGFWCVQWGNRNPRFVCISLGTLHDEAAPWFLFLHFLSSMNIFMFLGLFSFFKKQMRALRAVSLVNKQTRRQLVWDVIHIEVRLLDHPLRFNILLQMAKRKKRRRGKRLKPSHQHVACDDPVAVASFGTCLK